MDCFCGCGLNVPRFPLGLRAINKRGERIREDVTNIEMMLERGLESPNAEAYVRDGYTIMDGIGVVVHSRTVDRETSEQLESYSRDFLRRTRQGFTAKKIGDAISKAGYSSVDDAVSALSRGEFDPFA